MRIDGRNDREALERLAALISRPRKNQLIYHGVFAPKARLRPKVVVFGAPPQEENDGAEGPPLAPPSKQRRTQWADLMRRAFELDVLECPSCGGRMRLIATIEHPKIVRRILSHLGLPTSPPAPAPARSPPPEEDGEPVFTYS